MKRECCLTVVAVALLASPAWSQVTAIEPPEQAQAAVPKLPVIKLAVHAAPAPVPALRYRLLPELRDMEVGNAALRYYRAFSPEWFNTRDPALNKALRQWQEERDKMPPEILLFQDGPMSELERGARRTYCDWDMLRNLRKEGISMLLPDVQGFRTHAYFLAARARSQMAKGQHDAALRTLQTGFAFSRHVADGPTLIQSLVGMAIAQEMVTEAEHFVQAKDAPNLYWALTDMPRPFISLRTPLQGEKIMIDSLFPGFRDMANDKSVQPMTQKEIDALLTQLARFTDMMGIASSRQPVQERLTFALLAAHAYPSGREHLLQRGVPEKVVAKMPVTQVALMYEVHNFDRNFDNVAKWYGLPYAVVRGGIDRAEMDLRKAKTEFQPGTFLASLLLPATQRVFDVSYMLDRKLASLRCVEAVRLYAAKHGKLPDSLTDIKEVPIPDDPITGKSFEYQTDGNTASLTAPHPPGSAISAHPSRFSWTYEITLRR